MADFRDVVEEIKKTNTKLVALAKASDPKGAAAAEDKRDVEIEEKKKTSLLRRIAEGVEGGDKKDGKDKDKKDEGFSLGSGLMASIMGGLTGVGVAGVLGTMMAGLGLGALVAGGVYAAFKLFKSGLAGMDWAKEMGMETGTGFIAGFLGGGKKGGWMNAAFQAVKGMAAGATAGFAVGGPVGMVVGALVGGALFGLAGFFGAEKIAELIDPMVVKVKTFLGLSTTLTDKEKKIAETKAKELTAIADARTQELEALDKKLGLLMETGAPQKMIDTVILQKAKLERATLDAAKKARVAREQVLENERVAEKNALNAAEAAVSRNVVEVLRLKDQERRLKSSITMHGADTKEGQVAAAELAAVRVKLRLKVAEGKKLREDEVAAEEVLLKEDRRLLALAAEKGDKAPWRARLNVWTTDTWISLGKMWTDFTNWIYSPGEWTPGGMSSAKLFGATIPSMGDIGNMFLKKWESLKGLWTDFTNWIYTPGGGWSPEGTTSAKLFGISLGFPSIGAMFKAGWDGIGNFFIGIADWVYTKGTDEKSAILFGMELGYPSIGAMIEAAWDGVTNFFSGIGDWIYTPGTAATMAGAGTSAKLFGFELKFPDFDISLPTKEDLMNMLPEWMQDFKLPSFPDFKFPKLEDLTMPDFDIKKGWDKLAASAPQWIKDNIFDPGGEGRGGSGGGTSSMKIFGMELKFPSLNISFEGMADKIRALLPKWLTDPAGYIKGLVADMAKILPGMGGDDKVSEMSKDDIAEEIEDIKKSMKRKAAAIQRAEVAMTQTGIRKPGTSWWQGTKPKANAASIARNQMLVDRNTAESAELQARLKELEAAPKKQMGGPVSKGKMYNSHFGSGELFVPDSSGMILSAQRVEQIMQAGLQRGGAGGGGGAPTIVNAPVTSINNSSSNMTNTTTSYSHPSEILNRVNVAA